MNPYRTTDMKPELPLPFPTKKPSPSRKPVSFKDTWGYSILVVTGITVVAVCFVYAKIILVALVCGCVMMGGRRR